MPIFYFNLRHGSDLVEDRYGTEFKDLAAAREEAVLSAREILAEGITFEEEISARQFEICDRDGERLAVVPFTAALRFH